MSEPVKHGVSNVEMWIGAGAFLSLPATIGGTMSIHERLNTDAELTQSIRSTLPRAVGADPDIHAALSKAYVGTTMGATFAREWDGTGHTGLPRIAAVHTGSSDTIEGALKLARDADSSTGRMAIEHGGRYYGASTATGLSMELDHAGGPGSYHLAPHAFAPSVASIAGVETEQGKRVGARPAMQYPGTVSIKDELWVRYSKSRSFLTEAPEGAALGGRTGATLADVTANMDGVASKLRLGRLGLGLAAVAGVGIFGGFVAKSMRS